MMDMYSVVQRKMLRRKRRLRNTQCIEQGSAQCVDNASEDAVCTACATECAMQCFTRRVERVGVQGEGVNHSPWQARF